MSGPVAIPWHKNPRGELVRMAWPIAVSMVSYSVMTMADTAFVGTVGSAAQAGLGLAGTLAFALVVFGMGLLRGVKVLASQAVGAGKHDSIEDLAAAGLWLSFGIGALVIAAGWLTLLLLPVLASSNAAAADAADYLVIRVLAAPIFFVFCTTREVSYAVGDSRSPMIASVTANLLNIALDYLFIIRLGLGTSGAGWATFAATVVEAAIICWLRGAPGFRSLKSGVHWLRRVLHVGTPTGIQFTIEVGAFTVLTVLISAMSESQMAGHQVALSLIHFAFLPVVAVGEAGSVLAGQAVGANRDDLVLIVAFRALALGIGYAFMWTVLLAFGAPWFTSFFSRDPEVLTVANHLLYVGAFFQVADAFNICARALLRGTGDVRFPAIVGASVSWIALPPLTWLLGMHYGLGALGGWLGLTCEIVLVACVLWWRLLKGGWRPSAARSRLSVRAGV